jgi:hypothetical protein
MSAARSEHKFRLAISLAGLAVLIWIIASGRMTGFAWVEVGGIGGAFFGGSALWSAWKLWTKDTDQ